MGEKTVQLSGLVAGNKVHLCNTLQQKEFHITIKHKNQCKSKGKIEEEKL